MERFFETRAAASAAAADQIAATLDAALSAAQCASLVVSGGTTPKQCFAKLSTHPIDWPHVLVLASDDRWVARDHDDSNEKLIRENLLVNAAAGAEFLPYFKSDMPVEQRCQELNQEIDSVALPFSCSLLGMGADGHFASLFPDADNLAVGLDLDAATRFLPVATEASPYARISLTLAALARSNEVVLLFFGDDKRAVYDAAKNGAQQYPVSQLLQQQLAPVHIFWAP